jgi:hypothetical protein
MASESGSGALAPDLAGGSGSGAAGGSLAPSLFARAGAPIIRFLNWLTAKLENRKVEAGLFIGLFVLLLGFTIFRPLFPNYDTYYALIWGNEIRHGHLPDYFVFNTPTPHPLFNAYTAILSVTGGAAIEILLILSLAFYVGLLYGVYRMVQLKIGTLVAFFAVLVLLTRTDLMAFAFRSMLDIPFLTMVVWAVVLELMKPRRGLAPLVLLTLCGLLRPEAWLLAGLYWLWLAAGYVKPNLDLPGERPKLGALAGYALLVVSAPIIWLTWDAIVTGHPFYSITSTRQVAGALNRQKSLPSAIVDIPKLIGGSEKIVNVIAGALGVLLAIVALRSRMLMLAALAAIGILTYSLIAVAGLSVISRYLVIPSIVLCIGVAFALVGWMQMKGTLRAVGIGLAIFTLALLLYRAPAYLNNFRQLNTNTDTVSVKFSRIYDILDKPKIRSQVESCLPLTAFTHESVPVIRYLLDLPKQDVPATTQLTSAPTEGTQMIQTSALDPLQMTVVDRTLRKPWTGFVQPGFKFRGENRAWIVYTTCRAK